MRNDVQARLLGAVYACLRPLARVLLRSGVTYKSFAEVAKRAFIHEALLERDAKGRITNASRVAVRTGLSRKEVRKVCDDSVATVDSSKATIVDHSGPPARVLNAWHLDSRFVDNSGKPIDLQFEGSGPNFVDLVKLAGGDVPPGAVRAELLRATAMVELENGLLRPAKRYYVPGDFDEKTITILSGILYPMIAAVDHNADPGRKTAGYIQRFAYGRLAPQHRDAFKLWARQESTEFVEEIDNWLAAHEADKSLVSENDPISGIGVFFYEGPTADNVGSSNVKRS